MARQIVSVSSGLAKRALMTPTSSPSARSFSACYLRGGELVAVDTVNHPKDQMAARKLIAAHVRPNPDKLGDPAIALKDAL